MVRFESDPVQLERERSRLDVELSADVVEQREFYKCLDVQQPGVFVWIEKPIVDSAVVLERGNDVTELVVLVFRAIGLIANLDRVSSKHVSIDPDTNFLR